MNTAVAAAAVAPIALTKGGNIAITKDNPGLKDLKIGLAWDTGRLGKSADLDAMLILVGKDGKVRSNNDFLYFGVATQAGKPQGSQFDILNGLIKHSGDNLTGDAVGDDEVITITDFSQLPLEIEEAILLINLWDAQAKGQNFGQISNAKCTVYLPNQPVSVDLSEDCSTFTHYVPAKFYRHNGEWKFKALQEGGTEKWPDLLRKYGFQL